MIDGVKRVAAFCAGDAGSSFGGNPAGVWTGAALPPEETMRQVAAEVGYSETVFAARDQPDGHWRVRYFSPESEVPFCGHATIALGAVLALEHGAGTFALQTNHARVTVEGNAEGGTITASLVSPAATGTAAPQAIVDEALALFGYTRADLDERIPAALANGGAGHLILALRSRAALAAMRYDLAAGRTLMRREGWATIALVHAETPQYFHARNPFASGGVYEDPATGAAAAALAGYLRDSGWPETAIDIVQGENMGVPCRLQARALPGHGAPVRVAGLARLIGEGA
ncbi:PhzF family phenazine biosynthesis protein [Pseudoduganella umbonata]|uniref:PhzF family phenazine biosynthesis protein n=1 Tax=Pseudoduganella umbonata TaxID=864828 RepID=A0A4P8HSM6_9BURK|nr:PhzF family phenazine biosynthesis protein [Pseudoduganella umbonata]MBB3225365.1 PhzF family phenazine biosynthesis protein [Pseudoduganella umbonata]QCP11530.1 PhzF family phenazine biosynthesis protein [Pseudoduganella umbonata]